MKRQCTTREEGDLVSEAEGWGEARRKAFICLIILAVQKRDNIVLVALAVFKVVIQLSLPWLTPSLPSDLPHLFSCLRPSDPGGGQKHLFSTCNGLGTLLGTGDSGVEPELTWTRIELF